MTTDNKQLQLEVTTKQVSQEKLLKKLYAEINRHIKETERLIKEYENEHSNPPAA